MNPSSSGLQPSTSTSARIPQFDLGGLQKNISKLLNRKTYVPNLSISRNAPNRSSKPESSDQNITSDETVSKKSRKPKVEREILPAAETFAPATVTPRNKITIKGRSGSKGVVSVSSGSVSVKKEIVDKSSVGDADTKQLLGTFERVMSAPSFDAPVSIPHPRAPVEESKKSLSLLTEIMKPDPDESALFLLKTPKYLPALLDKSKNPKVDLKNEEKKGGHKCTIRDLPEGQIGKLQIMKSGRLRLVLGDCKFSLHQGVQVNFKEELAVVKTDAETRTGEIINLGQVQDRVIVVPENVTKLTAFL